MTTILFPVHQLPNNSLLPLLPVVLVGFMAHAAPPGYVKTWEDTFDGPLLDTNNWTIGLRDPDSSDLVPGAAGDFLLNTGYAGYVTPDDVVITNGNLRLLNQKRTVQGTSPAGTFDYTSGWVMSMHKVYANKGYLEWRAKFPVGDKVWPALWLIAEDLVWGPEWDCFEYFGYRSDVGYDVMGLHLLRDEWPDEKWSSYWIADYHQDYDAEAWHVYGFEWTDTMARWFIDGAEVRRLDNSFGASWPDEPMYLVMNNGVRSDSPENGTVWPNALEIDYVVLYQGIPAEVPVTINNHSFEADGAGKQPGTVPTDWSTEAPVGEGFEPAGATDGVNAALLDQVANNPGENTNTGFSLYQTTSHLLSANERLTLTFDARRTWTTTFDWGRVRAFLYYETGGVRQPMTNIGINLPDASKALGVTLRCPVADPAAIGQPLGVEFRSESWGTTWVTVDNIRLSVLAVPQPVLTGAGFNGNGFEVQATNLVPGLVYHLKRDQDLSAAPSFGTTADTRTAESDSQTFTDSDGPSAGGGAFYQVSD